MYRSKKDVDRHVQELFRKIKSESEENLRSYSIAKLYYQVGDYESAKRYVSRYLEVRNDASNAHKLLGQILHALGQNEAALAEFKISLELEGKQDDLLLKVCELLVDPSVKADACRIRYWVDRAQARFPHHPVVFQLKEKMVTEHSNGTGENLEDLIRAELLAKPKDVSLRIKLVRYYKDNRRLDEAYGQVKSIEERLSHRNSIDWYRIICDVLSMCKEKYKSDKNFWLLYVSSLERLAALSMIECDKNPQEKIPDELQAVFNFDQSLMEYKNNNSRTSTYTDQVMLHMWGQLHFHVACLLLKRAKREQGIWGEAGRLCAPLLLAALHVTPIETNSAWFVHISEPSKTYVKVWNKEASYRCSQAGHVLQDYAKDDVKKLMEKIDKFCTGAWRERIHQRIFSNRGQQINTSYFAKHNGPTFPFRFCSSNELKHYDEISEEVWPESLHHQVWLGIVNKPNSSSKDTLHPNQHSHLFPGLQFSVYNLSQASSESLSQLDIDAFLNITILCTSVQVEQHSRSGYISPDRLPTLPACFTHNLSSVSQDKWWSAAYKMYAKQEEFVENISTMRQDLQRGLEIIRCIGSHGLHPSILVHLGRMFSLRAKQQKESNRDPDTITALEARAELYWSAAVPLLERLQNNQTIKSSPNRYFDYMGKNLTSGEIQTAVDEGKLLLTQRLLREKQHEQAIEALQALKCPEASFQQALIYKELADEIVNSLPRENLTSEMRSQHIIMLTKARNCFYLTLDRLRSPVVNPKHPLNSVLSMHISGIENELTRIDPDVWRNDAHRNECDALSDESYSSAHSGAEQQILHNSSYPLLNNSLHMVMSTPQTHNNRNKHSSTAYRVQHQDVLELSRNRNEARPSPERLDAQIRQLIHSRDNIIQTLMEQNKSVLETNKAMLEKLDNLRISVDETKAELRREMEGFQKEIKDELHKLRSQQQQQQTPHLPTLNPDYEDLYGLGDEDYNDASYAASNASKIANASLTVGNMFASQRAPYTPLMYPSPALPGYYQSGMQFPDPSTQAALSQLYQPYNMPMLYPRADQIPQMPRLPDANLQQSFYGATRMPDVMTLPAQPPPAQPLPAQVAATTATTRAPPVNVVITSSDTLPTAMPTFQPTLSVTIPAQHRLGGTTTTTTTAAAATVTPSTGMIKTTTTSFPHNYQISMPSQATIPTTVNLPMLPTTFMTTVSSIASAQSKASESNARLSVGSHNSSYELVQDTEHDPIPDFAPIIPLPAEVQVTTGEEDEAVLYCARAKLYRFVDKEWKERGVGNVKLLKNKEAKVRLLMRREQVLKVCANHLLTRDMELTAMSNNDKAWIWVANDFADEQVTLEKFCIKFKTAEEAAKFKEKFDAVKNTLPASPNKSETKSGSESDTSFISNPPPSAASSTTTFSFGSSPIIQKTPLKPSALEQKLQEQPAMTKFTFGTPDSTSSVFGSNASTKSSISSISSPIVTPKLPSSVTITVVPKANSSGNVLAEHKVKIGKLAGDSKAKDKGKAKAKLVQNDAKSKVLLQLVDESGQTLIAEQELSPDVKFSLKKDKLTMTWMLDDKYKGKGETSITFDSHDEASKLLQLIKEHSGKSKKETKQTKSLSEMFKPASGSWECKQCYVRNNESANVCMACQSPSPTASAPAGNATSTPVKMDTKGWTCSSCKTKNDDSKEKCSSCGIVPLFKQFKKPTGWECTACYISNSVSNDYCVACNSPKDPSMPPKPQTLSSTGGFNLGTTLSTAGAPSTFSFGIPQSTGVKETSGFTFKMPSFGAEAGSGDVKNIFGNAQKPESTTTDFTFGFQPRPKTPPNTDENMTFGSPGKQFDFFMGKSPGRQHSNVSETSEDEVPESEDVYFAPVVALPDKVEVKTGEEDEEVAYSHRAKLFRYDTPTKQWKERGLGDIKLLKHRQTGKLRLVMRREQVLKLCLNHSVNFDFELKEKGEKGWMWTAADYSENKIDYEQFAALFKTAQIAGEFKEAIYKAKANLTPTNAGDAPHSDTVEVVREVARKEPSQGDKDTASKLQLPEDFFDYKEKPECPGCRGCGDGSHAESLFARQTEKALPSKSLTQSKSQPTKPALSFSSPLVKQENSAKPAVTSPFSTNNASNVFGAKFEATESKPSAGLIFGAPAKDTKEVEQLDKLKVCSPSVPAQPAKTTSESAGFIFGGPQTNKSIFGGVSPGKSLFGGVGTTQTTQATTETPNLFSGTTNTTGSIFNTAPVFGSAQGGIFGGTNTSATPTFGSLSNAAKQEPKKDGPFLPTENSMSFSALASVAPVQAAFKNDPNFCFAGAGTAVFGSKPATNLFISQEQQNSSQRNDETGNDEEDENEVENEHDPHFEPIIPLPDAIEVRTGEEDEEKVFSERAKLYRFTTDTSEWKERGVGEMKILKHRVSGKYRFLLRREQVHKIVCNMLLSPEIEMRPLASSDKAWMWIGHNYVEENATMEKLAVRFKTPVLAQAFKEAVDKAQQDLIQRNNASQVSNEDPEESRDVDEIDENYDDEEDYEEEVMFEEKATLHVRDLNGEEWESLPEGYVKVIYDSNMYGAKIYYVMNDGDEIGSETIITIESELMLNNNECTWVAMDYATAPTVKRYLRAVFEDVANAEQMSRFFQDGLEFARGSGIHESDFS